MSESETQAPQQPAAKKWPGLVPADRVHKLFHCRSCDSDISETEFKPDRATGFPIIECPRPGCHSRFLVFTGKWIGLNR